MKILVAGCGSIGERHIRNLKNFLKGEITAFDIDRERLKVIGEKYNIKTAFNFEKVIDEKGTNAVIICTPPNLHIPFALYACKKNIHCFIEKPLSHNLDGVDELISIAKMNKLIIFVGYNLRFNSGFRLVKKMLQENKIGKVLSVRAEFGQYLPDWRPQKDYRLSYTAKSEMGGGILLDGSHEIDYLCSLFGEVKEVFSYADKISNLEVDVEDNTEILLKFENGLIANLHLDFLQRAYTRFCRIVGEDGTIIWDYAENLVKIYQVETGKWQVHRINEETNEMYVREMKHFLQCLKDKKTPPVGIEDARKTLEIVLAAKKSAKEKKVVRI